MSTLLKIYRASLIKGIIFLSLKCLPLYSQTSVIGSEYIHLGKGTKFFIAEIDSIETLTPSEIYVIGDAHIEGLSSHYQVSYITDSEKKDIQAPLPTDKKERPTSIASEDKKSKRTRNDSLSVCKVTPCQSNTSILIALGKKQACSTTSKNQKQNIPQFSYLIILSSFYKYSAPLPEYKRIFISSHFNEESVIRPPPVYC